MSNNCLWTVTTATADMDIWHFVRQPAAMMMMLFPPHFCFVYDSLTQNSLPDQYPCMYSSLFFLPSHFILPFPHAVAAAWCPCVIDSSLAPPTSNCSSLTLNLQPASLPPTVPLPCCYHCSSTLTHSLSNIILSFSPCLVLFRAWCRQCITETHHQADVINSHAHCLGACEFHICSWWCAARLSICKNMILVHCSLNLIFYTWGHMRTTTKR